MTDPLNIEEAGYLRFTDLGLKNRKTATWQVHSTAGAYLGVIKWFGRWRCYAFFPNALTVFNAGCLGDLHEFCANATARHRQRRREEAGAP